MRWLCPADRIEKRSIWLWTSFFPFWPDNPASVRTCFQTSCKVLSYIGSSKKQPIPRPVSYTHLDVYKRQVLDPGHQDIVYRDEVQFPLDRQQFKKLYLDCANEALVETKPAGIHISTYQGDDGKSILRFSVAFSADTEISGYCKLHLWAAAEDYYDMDIYAKLNKRDVNGRYVFNDGVTFQYSGPNAMLRASLRQLDPDKSTESEPYHTFRTPQLLERGTPVELELGFWPTSLPVSYTHL